MCITIEDEIRWIKEGKKYIQEKCVKLLLKVREDLVQSKNIDWTIGLINELLADVYIELSCKKNHASDCNTSVSPARLPSRCNCDSS